MEHNAAGLGSSDVGVLFMGVGVRAAVPQLVVHTSATILICGLASELPLE